MACEEGWSTADRREAVADLLSSTLASMHMPNPAAAAAAAAQTQSAAPHFPPPPPPAAAAAAAAGPQDAAAVQEIGRDSQWVAAAGCLQGALGDLFEGGLDPAETQEVEHTQGLVDQLALMGSMDVHARYLLAHMEVSGGLVTAVLAVYDLLVRRPTACWQG
jgi:hypothetical protein